MNETDARNLAERITRTWSTGRIGTDIWHEVLQELDHAPAEQALRTCRDTYDHQPSIAQFRTAYHAQFGSYREPPIDCRTCGGDGWETLDPEGKGRDMRPCRCRNGKNVEAVHERIINLNDQERRHTGHIHDPHAVGPPAFARHKEPA